MTRSGMGVETQVATAAARFFLVGCRSSRTVLYDCPHLQKSFVVSLVSPQ